MKLRIIPYNNNFNGNVGYIYDIGKEDMKCGCGGELEPVFRPSYVKDGCVYDGIAEEYIGDKCVECGREYEED